MADNEYVWAVDANGNPCKCFASPENRGRGRCNHFFHAAEGQSQKEFFDMLSTKSNYFSSRKESKEIKLTDLPDYKDTISSLISHTDRKYKNATEIVENALHNNSFAVDGELMQSLEPEVLSEKYDPETQSSIITMKFTADGNEYIRSFSIPKMNEQGEYIINGVAYRYIPTLNKSKTGVKMTSNGKLVLSNDRGLGLVYSEKDSDTAIVIGEKVDGKIVDGSNEEVPLSEIEKYLKGEKYNYKFSDKQKENLDSLSPVVSERINKSGGISELKKIEPDQLNDLEYRGMISYGDRVGFAISKQLRSMDSNYRNSRLKGNECPNLGYEDITEQINKNLSTASYMQLSENLNPISALSQSQRVSWTGETQWGNDNLPAKVRLPHKSYEGLVDVNDVSLGGRVGATVALKGYIDKDGYIKKSRGKISGTDFIPYSENSDPNRSSMAISQMKQACPIIGGEDPKLSTKGWDKIKGSKLGVNLNVAYVADEGTWEDAVVISESAAKKMATVQTKKYQFKNSDMNTYIEGDFVEAGTVINGTRIEHPGRITNITMDNCEIATTYQMSCGDKVSGRYGNKGVVSKILPDDEMPLVNGKKADMMMSPIGVVGRKNLGQIYEVNGGKFNKKSKIEYNGHTTEGTGGTQFIMRINQIAEKKLLSNSVSRNYDKNFKARFGEMENILLTTNPDRLKILREIKHQEHNFGEEKLQHILKGIGVRMEATDSK